MSYEVMKFEETTVTIKTITINRMLEIVYAHMENNDSGVERLLIVKNALAGWDGYLTLNALGMKSRR